MKKALYAAISLVVFTFFFYGALFAVKKDTDPALKSLALSMRGDGIAAMQFSAVAYDSRSTCLPHFLVKRIDNLAGDTAAKYRAAKGRFLQKEGLNYHAAAHEFILASETASEVHIRIYYWRCAIEMSDAASWNELASILTKKESSNRSQPFPSTKHNPRHTVPAIMCSPHNTIEI